MYNITAYNLYKIMNNINYFPVMLHIKNINKKDNCKIYLAKKFCLIWRLTVDSVCEIVNNSGCDVIQHISINIDKGRLL